jgi:hypothetical protein
MAQARRGSPSKRSKKGESPDKAQEQASSLGKAMGSEEPKDTKKALQESFKNAYQYIKDQIVLGTPTGEELDITAQFKTSQFALTNYVTLDWQHYQEIESLMQVIRDYSQDRSRRRPLNIIMQAEPGSGKSHFIKCLAQRMASDGIDKVTFNMASMQGVVDLIQPLEAVRNLKVVDKLPILFLDEFDANKENYALLLPLLWDGELGIGHRELRLGKVVIILAGSGSHIGEVMRAAKSMQRGGVTEDGKLIDLLSRINGGELTIPALDEVSGDRDRRVDKVCLTLSLLNQRFGSKLRVVPWSLLKFVADTKFQHGVRSISHLVDLIPSKDGELEALRGKDLRLPLNTVSALKLSSLAYHLLAEDGPAAVVEAWQQLKSNETAVRFGRSPSRMFEMLLGHFDVGRTRISSVFTAA